MAGLELVDELYESFIGTLPRELVASGRGLACTLRLAPPGIPWSEVFGHVVTLAAPALFADAMPGVPARAVRDAVMAQSLAAIEAFGTDRIEDGQIVVTGDLVAVLKHVRAARDAALRRVVGDGAGTDDPEIDFDRAHARTLGSIAEERATFAKREPIDFAFYERVSLGKQSVGFPPSLALAHAAGWNRAKRRAMSRVLTGIWLGLQMPDDVADWEDDFSRGGAWAVLLSGGPGAQVAQSDAASLRPQVFGSGTLVAMLARARWHFSVVRRLGRAFGAERLAAWGEAQERRVHAQWENEQKSAGFHARAHALIAWAAEVLP